MKDPLKVSTHFTPRRVLIQRHSQRDELREHPDPVPLEVTPGSRPATLEELVRAEVSRLMRESLSAAPEAPNDSEAPQPLDWEEFDDDEDDFGLSGYQLAVMDDDITLQNRQREMEIAAAAESAGEEPAGSDPESEPSAPEQGAQ